MQNWPETGSRYASTTGEWSLLPAVDTDSDDLCDLSKDLVKGRTSTRSSAAQRSPRDFVEAYPLENFEWNTGGEDVPELSDEDSFDLVAAAHPEERKRICESSSLRRSMLNDLDYLEFNYSNSFERYMPNPSDNHQLWFPESTNHTPRRLGRPAAKPASSMQTPAKGTTSLSDQDSEKIVSSRPSQPYVRPKYNRPKCPHCDVQPEGFRGEHELRRHIQSKHANTRRVWICIDKSPDKTFLSLCKHCQNQKQYGAYYNAAAHLRRAHFNPRKRGRKSRDEWRGPRVSRTGSDPPMEVLREWMQEIEVPNEEHASDGSNDDAAVSPDEDQNDGSD